MRFQQFALFVFVLSFAAANVNAAVRGGKFAGTIYSSTGNSADATLTFATVGNGRFEVQTIGGIANSYPGTYTEAEFGPLSFWTADYTGAETFESSGISLFSTVSTYWLTNNSQFAALGILFKTGVPDVEP